jgi:DNA relaxase NicK
MDIEQSWLVELFCRIFGQEFDECEFGFWSYDRHVRWPCGAMVLYHSTATGAQLVKNRIALEIPGRALETLDAWDILMLCVNLDRHGFQASRVDVYFDDADRIISPSKLYETIYEPSLFSGAPIRADFSGFRVIRRLCEAHASEGLKHDEVSFGRRGTTGSGKYLRCYDKALESDGQNQAVRWELELSDEKARLAFSVLVKTACVDWKPEQTASMLGCMIGGCIDFKVRTDRAGDKNLNRLARYEFWQRIIEKIGRAKLDGKRNLKTIEKAREWTRKQCAGTLQMLHQALGAEVFLPWIMDIVTSEDRLRDQHRDAITEYRRALEGVEVEISGLRGLCDDAGIPLEGVQVMRLEGE